MTFTQTTPIKNPALVFGTLIGLGVLGVFMAKKKAAKKVAKKAPAKKKVAPKKKSAGVMKSSDIDEDDDFDTDESEVDQGHIDAHGNASPDAPTDLDKPTQI